jgi:hypothetical protein
VIAVVRDFGDDGLCDRFFGFMVRPLLCKI